MSILRESLPFCKSYKAWWSFVVNADLGYIIGDLYFELLLPDRTGAPPRWPRGSQIRKQFGNPSNLRNQISPWQDPWLQGGPRVCHYFGNCRISNIILTSFGPNHSLFEKSFSCHHSVMWSRTLIGSRRTPTTDLVTTKITPTPLSLASSQGSNTKNIRFKRWCKEHLFTTKPFQRSFWGVEKHLLLFRVQLSIYISVKSLFCLLLSLKCEIKIKQITYWCI